MLGRKNGEKETLLVRRMVNLTVNNVLLVFFSISLKRVERSFPKIYYHKGNHLFSNICPYVCEACVNLMELHDPVL